jgi:hypothetical protein
LEASVESKKRTLKDSVATVETVNLNPHRLMSRSDVDKHFDIPKRFLEISACKGGGPAFIKIGRLTRYKVSDILDWINTHRFENTSQLGLPGKGQ